MRKLSSRLRTSSLYMYNEVFQDGPLPWAACSSAWSPFQWRNVPLISNLKDSLVHLEAIFPGPESFTLGGEYLINVCKYLKGACEESKVGLFTVVSTVSTSEHQDKQFYCQGNWALLQFAQKGCEVSSVEILKSHLDTVLSKLPQGVLEQGG